MKALTSTAQTNPLTAAFALLLLASPVLAQTAPVSSGATARKDDQAVQLTAFTVSEAQDVGYESMQTTSGMRTVQELKNLANSISIMNSQFIEDLGLTTMEEMSTWMVSGESNPDPNATVQSRIILRGISNAYALRNGWIWYSPMDSFSTERVEELRPRASPSIADVEDERCRDAEIASDVGELALLEASGECLCGVGHRA